MQIAGSRVKGHPVGHRVRSLILLPVIFQNLDLDICDFYSLIDGGISLNKSLLILVSGIFRIRHLIHFFILLLPDQIHVSDKEFLRNLPAVSFYPK